MYVSGVIQGVALAPPPLLAQLIERGRWPNFLRSGGLPIGPSHPLAAAAGGAGRVCFLSPPFGTVAQRAEREDFWTWPCASAAEIDFAKTTCIADFGIGSDSPILLDYSLDPTRPRVIYLQWRQQVEGKPGWESTQNHWVSLAPTFDGFARLAGLVPEPRPWECSQCGAVLDFDARIREVGSLFPRGSDFTPSYSYREFVDDGICLVAVEQVPYLYQLHVCAVVGTNDPEKATSRLRNHWRTWSTR
jgi:hypothetical protein